MKHSKIYLLLLIPTAAFLLFAAGFCIGRNQPSDELRVVTARTPASQGTTAENETAPSGEIEGLGEKRIDAIRDYLTLEDSNENTGR